MTFKSLELLLLFLQLAFVAEPQQLFDLQF